jgi:hypothetical protein
MIEIFPEILQRYETTSDVRLDDVPEEAVAKVFQDPLFAVFTTSTGPRPDSSLVKSSDDEWDAELISSSVTRTDSPAPPSTPTFEKRHLPASSWLGSSAPLEKRDPRAVSEIRDVDGPITRITQYDSDGRTVACYQIAS